MVQHTNRINTVKWIHDINNKVVGLITGSDDKSAILWDAQNNFENRTTLKGHKAPISLVDGLNEDNENIWACTAATDHSIRIWNGQIGTDFAEIQIIPIKHKFCLSLKLHRSKTFSNYLLAYSCEDAKIVIMAQAADHKSNFYKKVILMGHEGWITGLDFTDYKNCTLLASCSEDKFIRLWKIQRLQPVLVKNKLLSELDRDDKKFTISTGQEKISLFVLLEAVLQGHEGWVSSVHWNKSQSQLKLLSSSVDKTLIIWTSESSNGIWTDKIRTGEVGGNYFGFFGAKFSPDGKQILGHGYNGCLHSWYQDISDETLWLPGIVVGGHFAEVQDICWEPLGKFLISTSYDKTTRIHAPWLKNEQERSWHEIARPQIHGYNINCLTALKRYRFASGAQEKIIRIFDAPQNFVQNFQQLCQMKDDATEAHPQLGASRPTLGLSNQAVNQTMDVKNIPTGEYPNSYFIETKLTRPPEEEVLLQNTLWPEVQKLYGHDGYEVFSLAATHSGKWMASACKASSVDHAQILIWNCDEWKVHQKLLSHQLTVTQMQFSPNDKYLLTVSRDRRWTVFKDLNHQESSIPDFAIKAVTDKSNEIHSRIIWCGSWSYDSLYFATGSREGKVVIWKIDESDSSLNGIVYCYKIETKVDVTALSFSHSFVGTPKNYLLAVGLRSGEVLLYTFNQNELIKINKINAHHLTIKKILFRPNSKALELASCSEDHSVKIYRITL